MALSSSATVWTSLLEAEDIGDGAGCDHAAPPVGISLALEAAQMVYGLPVEEGFDAVEVLFGVDADGVVLGGGDVEVEAVFEQAKLLEALGELERAGRELGEAVEGVAAIGVEADVLPVVGVGSGRGRTGWWRGRSRGRGRRRR